MKSKRASNSYANEHSNTLIGFACSSSFFEAPETTQGQFATYLSTDIALCLHGLETSEALPIGKKAWQYKCIQVNEKSFDLKEGI